MIYIQKFSIQNIAIRRALELVYLFCTLDYASWYKVFFDASS